MRWRSRSRLSRPRLHTGRPHRTAEEFAVTFFDHSFDHPESARKVFVALEALTHQDLSGLEPDDCLADLITPPDSLDDLETLMGLDLRHDPVKGPLARQALDEIYWHIVLKRLLGKAASRCTWDPETLPKRSVRGVIAQLAHLTTSGADSRKPGVGDACPK